MKIEHIPKETSKKLGETSRTLETSERAGGNIALVKTFFEVLSKAR